MPCLPGLQPVANDVQAAGVIMFGTDCRTPLAPTSINRPRAGNSPCWAQGRTRRRVAESMPMRSRRCVLICPRSVTRLHTAPEPPRQTIDDTTNEVHLPSAGLTGDQQL